MPYRLDITGRLQDRLLEVVRSAVPLITSSLRDADLAGLAHLRDEMIAAIEAYCRHVHGLRASAFREGDAAAVAYTDMLVAGCTSLQATYDAFRARWEHRQAVENWYEYRLSAIVMMKQVRNHVQASKRERTTALSLAA